MITKEELVRLLSVAYEEKARVEGKIQLLTNLLKISAQKEEQLKENKENKERISS